MKSLSLLLIVVWSQSAFGEAASMPTDDHFYQPDIKAYRKIINSPSSSGDQSRYLQAAIDEVAGAGGGILTIGADGDNNRYTVNRSVLLRSDVHIRIQPDVLFDSTSIGTIKLFSAGKTGSESIENFSFSGSDPDQFFTFDFSDRTAGGKGIGSIAIALGAVRNFRVADFEVLDNFTQFSAVTINLLKTSKTEYHFAKDGIIEHLRMSNGHYGYGLIQTQAAANILFRDLVSNGGVALRLESGAVHNEYLVDRSIIIDQIYGQNIVCTNGQAAITLSPHTMKNGSVFADNVFAHSCEAGAIVAAGFLSARKGQRDKDGNAINGHAIGSFDSSSVISNLKVTYGTDAQLRPTRRPFVPCSQRHLVNSSTNPDEESYHGPTVAGIVYYAKAGEDIDNGYYTVETPGLELIGFPKVNGQTENKEFVTSQKEYVRNCDISF